MKKILFSLMFIMMLLIFVACGNENVTVDSPLDNDDSTSLTEDADVNADKICISSVLGLNEQIYVSLLRPADGDCTVSYKEMGAEDFTAIDKELIIDDGDILNCYILGLKKGVYDVRIEIGEGENFARATVSGIDVEKQDRSGYAHFQREEGIGGYNNDGTVKENAKIIYVSNETKNTVTLDVNGTTYTGLVAILQAKEQMEEPLIVRVLDRISSNQFKPEYKLPANGNEITDEYLKDLFASDIGENLAGLPVVYQGKLLDKDYEYVTTPDGIELVKEIEEKSPYIDYDIWGTTGVISMLNTKDVTIEGVGSKAGFFQVTFYFEHCNSIDISNLTFSEYSEHALDFLSGGRTQEECTSNGWYWVHNNTFNHGQNYWDKDYPKSICMRNMRNATLSYNKFLNQDKVVLFGGWEYDYQLNVTLHHNYYLNCSQRTPLSRESNIHNYNNYIADCSRGPSPRTSTYLFSEANYFENVGEAYYVSGTETWGAVKSWGDIYFNCDETEKITMVTARDEVVENDCSPDGITDYSKFDTDPALFYYDDENKCSDVELMLEAKDVPEFVSKHAGAGILTRMDFPVVAE
ncbi:MAG: hypothetical protein IKT70_04570 [Clostridia bacterium]|nr:hypothetical protein [Clostridia bacterium]